MDPSYDVIIQDVCTLLKSCHQFFYDVWDPYYGFLKRKPPYIELHAQPLWDPRVIYSPIYCVSLLNNTQCSIGFLLVMTLSACNLL